MNAVVAISTFLLGDAQGEAWNNENGNLLEELVDQGADPSFFGEGEVFDAEGDEKLIAMAPGDGGEDDWQEEEEFEEELEELDENWQDEFDELDDEFGDDDLLTRRMDADLGDDSEVAVEAPEHRRPGVGMSALGFGVCRTASGGAGRYRGVRTITQEKCRAMCLADPKCVALEFTFMSSPINPGWCEIHYERITHKIYTVTNMCEVKIGAPIARPAPQVSMNALGFGVCRTASGGVGTYRGLRTITQEKCRSLCLADSKCVALEFTFMSSRINPGWCEIHTERITHKVYTTTNMCEVKVVRGGRRLDERLDEAEESLAPAADL